MDSIRNAFMTFLRFGYQDFQWKDKAFKNILIRDSKFLWVWNNSKWTNDRITFLGDLSI